MSHLEEDTPVDTSYHIDIQPTVALLGELQSQTDLRRAQAPLYQLHHRERAVTNCLIQTGVPSRKATCPRIYWGYMWQVLRWEEPSEPPEVREPLRNLVFLSPFMLANLSPPPSSSSCLFSPLIPTLDSRIVKKRWRKLNVVPDYFRGQGCHKSFSKY
jgi:hypothetical protein